MWLVTRALNECNKGSQRILGRVLNSVFNVKAVIAAFNQEKALVGLRDCTTSPINRLRHYLFVMMFNPLHPW